MLSKEKKLEITDKIVTSNTFKNAPTSIAILRYLIKANLENRSLKESIIDIEFFGTKADSEKSNPRVRVTIYNLRNKLKSYYEKEGIDDIWQIKIDKGQYDVRYEKQEVQKRIIKFPTIKHALPYFFAILFLFALIISQIPKSKPRLWKEFFRNGHKTNLFIGDAFGYGGKTVSGLSGWTRDFSINNLDEYYEMLEKHPKLKNSTNATDFNYSTRMAENATHDLTRFFTKYKQDFEIKYATQTSFSDIKKGNTIYVGRLKNQKDFIYLFNAANPYFKIQNKIIEFSNHKNIADTTIVANSKGIELDYTVVSRIPGPNNTEQFFFFSDHDIGVMASVEYFTNTDSIRSFTNKYLKTSPYFTAIYKTKGKERINLDVETVMVVPFE